MSNSNDGIMCLRCDKFVHPVHEMQDSGRVLPCCPTCNGVFSSEPALSVAVTPVVEKAKVPILNAELDLVELMRIELSRVEDEVAHLQKRQAYAEKLRRMINAAEQN